MTSNNDKNMYGFTLLEIMVALAILTIGLLAIFRMHAQTISMNTRAKFNLTAPLLAQSKFSELETKAFTEISETGNFENHLSSYAWSVSISDIESEVLGQTADNLKKIDLTISFNNDEFSYNLRTYRYIHSVHP